MRAATEGSLPPVMPQVNLVGVLRREVRQGSPGEQMVESSPSRQRRPPCKTNKKMSDDALDAAALTYLLTFFITFCITLWCARPCGLFLEGKQCPHGIGVNGLCNFHGCCCHFHWALPGLPFNSLFLLILHCSCCVLIGLQCL